MHVTWHLVQYTRDLRRHEPRNVGVLLRSTDQWLWRFLDVGQARKLVASVEVYQTWVDYYQRKLTDAAMADIERGQAYRRGNYAVVPGGVILVEPDSYPDTLDGLFRDLVQPATGFYEDDEPVDTLIAAFDAGHHATTRRPDNYDGDV